MKHILRAVAAAAAVTATLAILLILKERVPDGPYCGSYASDLLTGKLNVKYAMGLFDLSLKGLGMKLNCTDEKFTYDTGTHHLTVLNIKDPKDCIGAAMNSSGLALDATYDPYSDIITLDFSFVKIVCKKCGALSYFRGAF
ncbi:hypothetical protein LSCM1_05512 [Leishmania martiniquensis]|uniref:Uncharacterized protein n=1 Tax=Leishmania martiniquensis TaxID=1580590 RepID=A0A836HRA2_9TRYP|nr:hypothetical protein LSCM1_05512 [Leishmania martiniquensis]